MYKNINKKTLSIISGVAVILVIVFIKVLFFSNNNVSTNKNRRNISTPVRVATVKQQDISHYLTGLGTVQAAKTVTVRSQVEGKLIALHFTEGQLVNEGDLLAEIDPREFQIQLQQAQGQLAKDQASLNNAIRDLKRYQQLVKTRVVSQQELDDKRVLVAQLQGTIQIDQAAVNQANLRLSYSQIRAPISGKTGLKRVDQGNYINANDTNGIVVITQTQPIDAIFTLPEREIPYLNQTSDVVEVWSADNSQLIASGSLLGMDNQIDPTTGTIKLKAQFDNQNQALFPNQFVNIKIKVATVKDALVLPQSAIQVNNQTQFAWVVNDDNRVKRYNVTTGLSEKENIEVKGLNIGTRVVIDGVDRLKDGSQIEIVAQDQ